MCLEEGIARKREYPPNETISGTSTKFQQKEIWCSLHADLFQEKKKEAMTEKAQKHDKSSSFVIDNKSEKSDDHELPFPHKLAIAPATIRRV